MEIIFIVEEFPEGDYEARALGHSIYTQGESVEGLKKIPKKPFIVTSKLMRPK